MAVYITIGNTDDKLGQKQWSDFVKDVDDTIRMYASAIHAYCFSLPNAPWQNCVWCCEFAMSIDEKCCKEDLGVLTGKYNQDSIAWAPAVTEFLTRPNKEY